MVPKRLGDLLPPEKISEGSKRLREAPSPFFPSKKKADIPPGFEWVLGLLDTFFLKLRRIVIKSSPPYWQSPPFEHIDIDMQAMVTIPPLPGVNTATILTITVPIHQTVVIRLYGQDIEATVPPTPATAWADIQWTFIKGGVVAAGAIVGGFPLQYFDAFVGQRGSLINLRPTAIVIDGPGTFAITATNIGVVSYDVTASIIGHQYSVLSMPLAKEDILEER